MILDPFWFGFLVGASLGGMLGILAMACIKINPVPTLDDEVDQCGRR